MGDGMVYNHVSVVVASVKDTPVVGAPVRGSIIAGKSLEAHGHHNCVRGCCVKLADIVVASTSTCIGIVVFCDNSKERGVSVGKRLDGSHATAGTTALQWVGDTADKVLRAQLNQIVSHVVDLSI